MPPKKKQKTATATPAKPTARRSKLAKENDISAEQEFEIKSAWALFQRFDVDDFEAEKEGVIQTSDVERALKAQNLAPKSHSQLDEYLQILDPSSDGYVTYPHFLEICAIQLNNKDNTTTDEDVDAAMKLFTRGVSRSITIQDLRSVAKTLKEDVGEDVLRAMVVEANGRTGVERGVEREGFRDVMVRAGVFQ